MTQGTRVHAVSAGSRATLAAAVLFSLSCGGDGAPAGSSRVPRELAFETLATTATAARQTRDYRVVTDDAGWALAWDDLRTGQPRPALDFRREMVVTAFAGARSNGCHELRVTGMREEASALVVSLVHSMGGPDCVCAAFIATPAHAVRVERVDKRPTFFETTEQRSCR